MAGWRGPWGKRSRRAFAVAACAGGMLPIPHADAQQPSGMTPAVTPDTTTSGTMPMPVWQAPAVPQAFVQGGTIPPGWQPQAVAYQGVGPDGKPVTMYVAPTYVFTFQLGPPVPAVPGATTGVARTPPGTAPAGWNYATSGAPPVARSLPAPTVTRYPPIPYQFPADSKALAGTPIVPPAGSPSPSTPPQALAEGSLAAPPTAWSASPATSTAAAAAPPSAAGDWVSVVPPATAAAVLASTAASSSATAAAPSSAPSTASGTPAQPVSMSPQSSTASATHLWRVVGVQDGDTLSCLDESNQQQKVALAGIDAPELGQDYGRAAREALAAMVFGKTIEVVDQGRDQYGRWVCNVLVGGMDVNGQMVVNGNAWVAPQAANDPTITALQSQAQSQRLGLWAQPDPTPPWVFRQANGDAS